MKAFFAIALLSAASLTDAFGTLTRIDSSLNDISTSGGGTLQGGSFISDAPVNTIVRSEENGAPMGGGLRGGLAFSSFGPHPIRTHTLTRVSGNALGGVTRTTHTTSVAGGGGVPGGPTGLPSPTLRTTETTFESTLGPQRSGSFLFTWGGPIGAPSSGFTTATAFHGNWVPNGGFSYGFNGGYPTGGFDYFYNSYYPSVGYSYAGHQNGGYGSGYGLGSSNYYVYPGFSSYAYGG
ncbi:shematrin-like protein 1 [Dermacentor silvarum]|uniref:shematrin-like protein 1 n=1 Tax=Dermacentor silvarum TaxID=543639 RepID=UPI002101D430|nr:shematrin-like protein 1 [Dermacentor silvarum]